MKHSQTIFAIPTCRLRDVAETVEAHDDNFRCSGHAAPIMVFDDSSTTNHEKYFPLLEQTRTANDVYYVGLREKEKFLAFLNHKLRDKKLESLVKNLFRPSYGGNFEPDFFQQNVARIVDDVISQIQASLELWPTIVEICYYQKDKEMFPHVRVNNKRLNNGH